METSVLVPTIEVEMGKNGSGIPPQKVLDFLQIHHAQWVSANDNFLSCVDGRSDVPVFATPAGDFGEWILGLQAMITLDDPLLTQEEYDQLFQEFMDGENAGRKFYWHTDAHALHHLSEALHAELHLSEVPHIDPLRPQKSLNWSDPKVVETLENLLVTPGCAGCGHIAGALRTPELYLMTPGLLPRAILAFFHYAWKGTQADRLHFPALTGGHCEKAVMTVSVKSTQPPGGPYFPAFPTRHDSLSSFLYHPDMVAYFRQRVVAFLAKRRGQSPLALEAAVGSIAGVHVSHTLHSLAMPVPWYTVTLRGKIPEPHPAAPRP